MKTKTIRKNIESKMTEWLETITDVELKKDVKSNLLVTGGCIASMFLKEPVNDYDVYIQDMDVLVRLAKYYCGNYVLDGRKRQSYLKQKFDFNDVENPLTADGTEFLSEEYMRIKSLKKDQVKLDIPGIGVRKDVKEGRNYQVVFLSQNAISLTDDVQIVLRFNGDAEQIHKTFDFVHATNYFTFKDGLVTNVNALECILTKELRYQGSLYPVTSIIRMKKFINRGFTMNAGEVLKMAYQCSELDLNDIEVLEEQLIGVDVAYFSVLIDALRTVDSKKLNSSYIATIIDKVFNNYDGEEQKKVTSDIKINNQ